MEGSEDIPKRVDIVDYLPYHKPVTADDPLQEVMNEKFSKEAQCFRNGGGFAIEIFAIFAHTATKNSGDIKTFFQTKIEKLLEMW